MKSHPPNSHSSRLTVGAACVMVLLFAHAAAATEPQAATSWELRPYQIQVLVVVDPAVRWPANFTTQLSAQISKQAAEQRGGIWRLECRVAPLELRSSILNKLDSLAASDVRTVAHGADEPPVDKVVLVSITAERVGQLHHSPGYQIAAREFDVATQLFGTSVARHSPLAADLGPKTFAAIASAFAPLARIETVADGMATLRLRGAALRKGNGRFSQLAAGQVLRPVLVNTTGDQHASMPRPITWTWLVPQSISDSLVRCRIHSGLSGPALPDYHPQRMRLAIAVTPPRRLTQLQLVSAGDNPQPLVGCDVLAIEGGTKVRLGRSDRHGNVQVPPGADSLRVLSIQYGQQTLARVPVVPGHALQIELACARDERRLAWETSLVELREDLLDFICLREGLLARSRASIAAKSRGLGQPAIGQLGSAQDPAVWLANLERHRGLLEAIEPNQRPAMEKELTELRGLLAKHLASGKTPATIAAGSAAAAQDATAAAPEATATTSAATEPAAVTADAASPPPAASPSPMAP